MSFSSGIPRRAAAALAVSAALLSTGCAHSAPGAAAYVGDTKISEREVDAAVTAVSSIAQEGQTVSTEAVVNAMIQGELSAQIARDKKIPLTDGQRDTFIKTTNLAPLLNVAGAKPVAYDVADQQIVSSKVGGAAYLAEVAKRKVTLNPRYGVLDPKQKTILEGQTGSLSQPAPQTP